MTRAAAIAAALREGPRSLAARADSSTARAVLLEARQYPNPSLVGTYSRSTPQQHLSLDVPLDFPWLRRPRVGAAGRGLASALHRFTFARAQIQFETDSTYTHAIAAGERFVLSRRIARDADSLVLLARLRRDAGDASELDVNIAEVNAGQVANIAATDSLEALTSLLTLQTFMGMQGAEPLIALADSMSRPSASDEPPPGVPLRVAAAEASLEASELALTYQRRALWSASSLQLGVEAHDPSGSETGILPTIGLAVPLPLLNRNRGAIAAARAERDRARAELTLARLESQAQLETARRQLALARQRVARDERLLAGASRVASLALLAYREGAIALPNVIEAQRTAREAQSQVVADLAALHIAAGALRLLSLGAPSAPPQ